MELLFRYIIFSLKLKHSIFEITERTTSASFHVEVFTAHCYGMGINACNTKPITWNFETTVPCMLVNDIHVVVSVDT